MGIKKLHSVVISKHRHTRVLTMGLFLFNIPNPMIVDKAAALCCAGVAGLVVQTDHVHDSVRCLVWILADDEVFMFWFLDCGFVVSSGWVC